MGQGCNSLCIAPRLLLHLLTQPQLPSHTTTVKACEFPAVPGHQPGRRAAIQPEDSRLGGKHSQAATAVKLSAGQKLAPRKRDRAMRNAELAADLRASHQARQIYRPWEGKAGPGQQRGLAQAPGEKTSREAAITPATALACCRQQVAARLPAGPAQAVLTRVWSCCAGDARGWMGHQPLVPSAHCQSLLPWAALLSSPVGPSLSAGTPPGAATALLV